MISLLSTFVRRMLVVAMAAVATSALAQQREPVIIQVSDPQLGFITESEDFSPEQELMARLTERINALKPDVVVFSGDLVHYRTDVKALEAFDRMMEEFDSDIPLYFVPGNHDVGNDASAEGVEAFIARYGHDRFVHKAKHYTLIGYNSCVIKAATAAEAAEYEWLSRELRRARRNKPIIVVAHHPLFLTSYDEAESYENIRMDLREKYLQLFEQYGVDMVLSGHLHKRAGTQHNGIEFITAGPAGRPFEDTVSGVEVITIRDGKPEARYVAIDDIGE